MRLDKVAQKLSGGQLDEGTLRMLARDLGHELPQNRLGVLRECRQMLARVPRNQAHPWGEGYRAAMLDLLAAYDSAVSAEQERQKAEVLLMQRGWREVLEELREGPRTQSQLADKLGMDKGQMSRLLRDMRGANLVEVFQAPEGEARSRPHQLTLRGQLLLKQQTAISLTEEDAALLRFAATFFARGLVEGRPLSSGLEGLSRHIAGSDALRVPSGAARLLEQEAQRLGVFESDNVSMPAVAPRASAVLEGLFDWFAKARQVPPFWQSLKQRLPAPTAPVLVRAAQPNQWRWLMLRADTLPDGELLPRGSRVFGAMDLELKLFKPPEQDFVLVYESPSLHRLDKSRGGLQAELEKQASMKLCFTAGPEQVAEGYERLDVETYIEPRRELPRVG